MKYIHITPNNELAITPDAFRAAFVANTTIRESGIRVEFFRSITGMLVPYPPSITIPPVTDEVLNNTILEELRIRLQFNKTIPEPESFFYLGKEARNERFKDRR